jgi:hypothetical protein
MFNIIKNKIKDSKLKTLYLEHLHNYKKLKQIEENIKKEELKDKSIKELKMLSNKNAILDTLDSFNLLKDNMSLEINSESDFYKFNKINIANGIVFDLRIVPDELKNKISQNQIILDSYIFDFKREYYTPENFENILYNVYNDKINMSDAKNYLKKALIKKQQEKDTELKNSILRELQLPNECLSILCCMLYVFCEHNNFNNMVKPIIFKISKNTHFVSDLRIIQKIAYKYCVNIILI